MFLSRLPLLFAFFITLSLSACSLNKAYVRADSTTFDAIAPEYIEYVQRDETLSEDQIERRLRTVESWYARTRAGEGQ